MVKKKTVRKEENIEYGRVMPLAGVLRTEWDDSWPEETKLDAVLLDGSPDLLVDKGLLSIETVLGRLEEFAADPVASVKGTELEDMDWGNICSRLSEALGNFRERCGGVIELPKNIQALLVIMYRLGTIAGTVNLQDMAQAGREALIQPHRANIESVSVRSNASSLRGQAIRKALDAAEGKGFKKTHGGLRGFLRSCKSRTFSTGLEGCAEVRLSNNDIFCAGCASPITESQVSKFKRQGEAL